MAKKNNCVAVGKTHAEVEAAVKEFRTGGVR